MALADQFRKHIDEGMLAEIAAADYGWKAEEQLPVLRRIRDTGELPEAILEVQEVLELIRWSEPEDPEWKPGSTGERGHWMRLFACAVLVRAGAREADRRYFTSEHDTLIQLVESARRLGAEPEARELLEWRYESGRGDFETPEYLALAIRLLGGGEEWESRAWINVAEGGMRLGKWQALAVEVLKAGPLVEHIVGD